MAYAVVFASWLRTHGGTPPEIDWPEIHTNPLDRGLWIDAADAVEALHWGPTYSTGHELYQFVHRRSTPLTDAWHTYKAVWTPQSVEFFIDGVSVGSITEGTACDSNCTGTVEVPDTPMHLVIDRYAGNWQTSQIDATTPALSYMDVDWVRASQP